MYTIKEQLNKLPEPYNHMAIEELNKQNDPDDHQAETPSIAVLISFGWPSSEMGTDFWAGIYDNAKYVEDEN